jgi:hypothetical protein
MGRTGRPNLIHCAIGDSAWPTPSRMLRGAPPAAGPTGTVGRARATPELHGAVRSGTAGCGLNRDDGPCTGCGSYASTHAHLGSPAARPFWDRGLRAGRRSCATRSGPTRRSMRISAPPAAGPARGPWAASGPEELRDSEWSRGCRRDTVTVCFQYLVPEVTVSDDSTIFLNWLGSIQVQNWTLRFRSCRLNWEFQVLKQTAGNPDQSSYNPNRM